MKMSGLKRLHRLLLRGNTDVGYTPYLWLIYLLFLLPGLYFNGWKTMSVWLTVLSVVVFLPFYFRGFRLYGQPQLIANSLVIALLGAGLLPFNSSASVYFIYAAAGVAFINRTRLALLIMAGFALWLVVECWLLGYPVLAIVIPALMVLMIGCANLFHSAIVQKNIRLRASQAEASRLAAVAERERISRDLHDLLGHTLSLITLKAELAGKLLQRDKIQQATQEVAELEQISREALSEVREAVTGYRQADLQDELQHAGKALKSARIALKLSGELNDLPQAYDNVLAMCVREGVTNVIRHAGANHCHIEMARMDNGVRLTISDNGQSNTGNLAVAVEPGSGLLGMRDRLASLGGSLHIKHQNGVRLEIELPLPDGHSQQDADPASLESAA